MPYYYSNYPISWKHFVTHRGGSSLLYLMTATIPYGFTEFLSDAQIQTIAALWNLAYYPWNGYDAVYSNAFCNLGVTNTGTYSFSYDAMQTWWWNTDNVHAEGGSGLPEQSEYANWPDFQGTPFTSDKWHKRPYMRNIGTPHIGSPTINFPEYCYAPGAVLWSDNGIVRSGLSYGLGQYSFIYTLNSTSVTIESPELPDILSCTGRDDLVLTNT